MRTVPESWRRIPSRIRIVVDLPAPLGPRKPCTSPRATSRSRPSRAVTFPYFLVTPEMSMAGDSPLAGPVDDIVDLLSDVDPVVFVMSAGVGVFAAGPRSGGLGCGRRLAVGGLVGAFGRVGVEHRAVGQQSVGVERGDGPHEAV